MRKLFIIGLSSMLLIMMVAGFVQAKTTITFMHPAESSYKGLIEDAVDRYNEIQDEVEVKYRWATWDGYWDKVDTMAVGENLPDVFRVDDDTVPFYAKEGQIIPLDEYITGETVNLEEMYPVSAQYCRAWDGQLYALPIVVKPVFGLYNKTLFKDNGLEEPPLSWENPWEWDTFVNTAKKIAEDTTGDGKSDIFGYSIGGIWDVDSMIPSNGGSLICDDRYFHMHEEEACEIVDSFYNLMKEGISPSYTSVDQGEVELLANSGKLGMWSGGPWSLGTLWESDVDFEWDVMPRPKRKVKSFTQTYTSTVAIPTYSKHKEEAVEFLKWITTDPEPQSMFMEAGTWGISPNPEVARSFSTPGKSPSDERDMIIPETPYYFGGLTKTTFGPEIRNIMKPAVEQVWTGQKTAKEAFSAIKEEANRIMEEARKR